MPVIRNIRPSLKTREVLRRQGLGGGAKVKTEIKLLIGELFANIKEARLLEPAMACEYHKVTD